jgi:hypothetical protein
MSPIRDKEDILETISTLCRFLDPIRLDLAWNIVSSMAQAQATEEKVETIEKKLFAAVQVLEIVQRETENKFSEVGQILKAQREIAQKAGA